MKGTAAGVYRVEPVSTGSPEISSNGRRHGASSALQCPGIDRRARQT